MAAPTSATDDFVRGKGLPFLAHLLRRIADRMISDAGAFYAEQGISAPARTASTLLLLAEQGPQSVTAIAGKLRQSHPLAITWIRQLKKLGFVSLAGDTTDRRRTLVGLTAEGRAEAERMAAALARLGDAYAALVAEAGEDLVASLWALEELTSAGRLAERLDTQS